MAAPTIRGSSSGTDTTGASVTATLPTHVTDDILVVVYHYSSDVGTWSTPSGWSVGPTEVGTALFYKVAVSASETDPVSTRAGNNRAGWITYAIQSADTTPAVDSATSDEAAVTTADPASASVTDGPKDILSIVFYSLYDGRRSASSDPTSYGVEDEIFSTGGGAAGVAGGSWSREITSVSSEDPGTFTITASSDVDTITFLIAAAASSTQTVTGVLFTRPPSFIAGQVNLTLLGVLFNRPPSFITGVVTPGNVTLSGVLFARPPSFIAGQVNMSFQGVVFNRPPSFIFGQVNLLIVAGDVFARPPTFIAGQVNL